MRKTTPFMAGAALAGWLVALPAGAQDAALIAAARHEGQVVWYTTLLAAQFAEPMAAAFERKFGVKATYVSLPSDLPQRVLSEAQAGRHIADVIDGPTSVTPLKTQGLILKWTPASAANYPPELVDPDGYWMATNLYVQTRGFNTDLVPKGSEPRSMEDFLDPKWRGKFGWSTNRTVSGGPGFIGATLLSMGQDKGVDYLRRLAKQNIVSLGASARTVLDQAITGEFPIGLQIFNYHAVISAAKGAPVAWAPSFPSTVSPSVVSVTLHAPHPNAAKLLAEFLVSDEGQTLFRNADYIPANPAVPPRDPALKPGPSTFTATFLKPEVITASMPGWAKLFDELFK